MNEKRMPTERIAELRAMPLNDFKWSAIVELLDEATAAQDDREPAENWRAVVATERDGEGRWLAEIYYDARTKAEEAISSAHPHSEAEDIRAMIVGAQEGALAVRRAVIAGMVTEEAIESAGDGYQDVLDGKTPGHPLRAAILAATGAPIMEDIRQQRDEWSDRAFTSQSAYYAEKARADASEAEVKSLRAENARLEMLVRVARDTSEAQSAELAAMRRVVEAAKEYSESRQSYEHGRIPWDALHRTVVALDAALAALPTAAHRAPAPVDVGSGPANSSQLFRDKTDAHDEKWHTICASVDGESVRVYVDGVEHKAPPPLAPVARDQGAEHMGAVEFPGGDAPLGVTPADEDPCPLSDGDWRELSAGWSVDGDKVETLDAMKRERKGFAWLYRENARLARALSDVVARVKELEKRR